MSEARILARARLATALARHAAHVMGRDQAEICRITGCTRRGCARRCARAAFRKAWIELRKWSLPRLQHADRHRTAVLIRVADATGIGWAH